jgi:hypothetical protein
MIEISLTELDELRSHMELLQNSHVACEDKSQYAYECGAWKPPTTLMIKGAC